MKIFKKYILTVLLIFILIFSAALCVHSLWNYKNNSFTKTTEQNSFMNSKNSMPSAQNNSQPNNGSNAQNGSQPDIKNGSNNSQFSKTQPSDNQGQMQAHGSFSPGNQNNNSMQRNMPDNNMKFLSGTDSKLSYKIIIYSIIFFGLSSAAFFIFIIKKTNIHISNQKIFIFTALIAGLLLRIYASTLTQGYSGDISLFKNWAASAANGLSNFYSNAKSSDYPPLYIYVLYVVGKIANISTLSKYFIILLKLPSMIADIAASYFIYKIAKKYFSYEISVLLSLFYILNPAVFINSALWGQVDSFFTLIIIIAFFMLSENKTAFSSVFFIAGVLMKPQGIIYLPILFFELVRQRNIKNFIKAIAASLITAAIIILPFSINKGVLWIFKLYSSTISEYPYASMNAFNFFSLIGANLKKDTTVLFIFNYHTWGMIFIAAITLFSWYIYIKGNNVKFAFASALVQIAGVFTFSVGMHERYLFPAVALSILASVYLKNRKLILMSIGYSITTYINTHVILFGLSNSIFFNPILILTSLLNIFLFIYLVKILLDNLAAKKVVQNSDL